ncbi:MAG: hypothetical protein GXY44_02460 [Phycisphaerales bacterium]|nr:hypothetical protein [Phycisphaerales bacterium]
MNTGQEKETVESARDGRDRIVIRLSSRAADAAPGWVLIAPWGDVESANGNFVLDAESARLVLEAFDAQGTDVPIDYEHQSLGGVYASPTGQAPAAGWIRALKAADPTEADEAGAGLFAAVEWTEAAREKLTAREYRYLSPVVLVRKSDRRVVALHSAALTNKPAIVGMKPIVNRMDDVVLSGEEGDLAVMSADGTADVDQPEVGTAERLRAAVEPLCLRLGLAADSALEVVLARADERLATLAMEKTQREAEEKVVAAMRAGKLLPPQREWAMALAMKDPAAFEEWLKQAPPVVMVGRTERPDESDGNGTRQAVIASARAAWRAEPRMASLTSEEAFVRDALREAGVDIPRLAGS